MKKINKIGWFIILSSTYCAFVVVSNLFEMKTIGTADFAFVGGGILLSWVTFLITDIVTEVYGKDINTEMFILAACINLFIVLIAQALIFIPGTYPSQNDAFRLIFSNGPRTIFSSTIAFILGNFINMNVMVGMKNKIKKDNNLLFFFRAVLSTFLGQLVDNLVFVVLAFAPIGISAFEMTIPDILTSVIVGTWLETSIEMIFVPVLTIPISKFISKLD